jgi:hypothetical protein
MTGHEVPGFHYFKQRLLFQAAFNDKWATSVKTTPVRRVDRTGNITGENDALAQVPDLRHRNARKQGMGIRM